jgi:hypothetical protein
MVRREAIAELRPSDSRRAIPAGANAFTGVVRDVVDLGLTRVVWLRYSDDGDAVPFNLRMGALGFDAQDDLAGVMVTAIVDPDMCVVFPSDVVKGKAR